MGVGNFPAAAIAYNWERDTGTCASTSFSLSSFRMIVNTHEHKFRGFSPGKNLARV